jgi:CheY-like chemotaxis protein/nitrogen-specific signal transduction histidine kinase
MNNNDFNDLIAPLNKELEERERRLESLSSLVNKLAHDFNNSLSPFTGWFSIIKEESPQDSQTYIYAQKGEDVSKKVKEMLENVISSVKPERRFNPVKFNLGEIVREELAKWKQQIPSSVNLEVYDDIQDCQIFSDPAHWRRAVSNLLDNARYGLALGGKLEISLKEDFLSEEKRRELGVVTNTPWLLLVKDNGLGIPADVMDKIFDPFFSTRSKNNSLGLGLTHVYGLARLHGGQVIVESEVDKGTAVYVWFHTEPVRNSVSENHQYDQTAQDKAKLLPGKKVLLVDDDPLVLEVLKAFLQKRGFNVVVSNNSKAALEYFKKHPDDFGIVISDIRMAGMNGIEFVKNILAVKGDIPVFFISGERNDVIQGLMSTLNRRIKVIKKPCTFSEFYKALEEVLGQKQNSQ